MILFWW